MLAAVLVPLLLLALLEVGLRLAGFGFDPAYWIHHPAAPPGALVENQRFSWRFFPRTLARHPTPTMVTPRKAPGVFRVLVFGESAAEGDPAPEFGFSRILEILLAARHPGVRVEVVNVAFTAINSNVILPIARDCARLEADAWVVYMGNNEVIGPYGAGTIFNQGTLPLPLIRGAIALKGLRLGQAVTRLAEWARPSADARRGWGGMTMFVGNQFFPDDPRLAGVYAHFADNLAAIIQSGRRAGAEVFVSTVASNLRDWPPFASQHRAGLGPTERATWDQAFAEGVQAEAAGNLPAAMSAYGRAAAIDDGHAELQFRLARCALAAGQSDAARAHFVKARDTDALRFRTDSRQNDLIRATARAAGAGVTLVEAAERLAADSPAGIPGTNCFHEHVHFHFAGNYRLARLFAEQLEARLPAAPAGAAWLDEAACAARLAFTGNLEYDVLQIVRRRFDEPIYQGQLDAAARLRQWDQRLAELRGQNKPAARERALQAVRQAVAARPDDAMLRAILARSLAGVNDIEGAWNAWQEVARRLPHDPTPHFEIGELARQSDRLDDAARAYQMALGLDPSHARSHEGLALIEARRGNNAAALRQARMALALDPTRGDAAALVDQLNRGARP